MHSNQVERIGSLPDLTNSIIEEIKKWQVVAHQEVARQPKLNYKVSRSKLELYRPGSKFIQSGK